jgi:hypothetical protein
LLGLHQINVQSDGLHGLEYLEFGSCRDTPTFLVNTRTPLVNVQKRTFFIRYKKGSFYFIKQIKASVSLEVSKGGNGLITCIANLVAPCGTGAWTGSTASRRAPCCTSSLREQQQWVLLIEKKKPKTWDAGGLRRLPAPAAMELPVRSFVSRILSSSPLFTAHRGPRRRRLLSPQWKSPQQQREASPPSPLLP